MPVPTPTLARLLLLAALLAAASAAQAQAVSLIHAGSVYEDDKDRPLRAPEGVACSDDGQLVVADTGNGRLLRLSFKNRALAGGTEVKLPQLPSPTELQLDGKGNLLVLDRKLRKIGRVDAAGAFQGYVEPRGEGLGTVAAGAFELDGAGNLWILDLAGVQLLAVDGGGQVVRRLSLPRGGAVFTDLAVDAAGTVYAVDSARSAVWSAEKGASALKPLVQGMKEVMTFPTFLSVSRGRLFVTDQNGHGIAVFGIDGAYQGRLLSLGWGEGLVYYPAQVCVNDKDELFVADRYNNRVQAFTMTAK